METIGVKKVHSLAILPTRGSDLSSGMDLYSVEEVCLNPGDVIAIDTGIIVNLPDHLEIQIRPRSGLALKHKVCVLNSPGTVDADYRGNIKVIMYNTGHESFPVKPGDRIAQAVFSNVTRVNLEWINMIDETKRGTGGFGSTGR